MVLAAVGKTRSVSVICFRLAHREPLSATATLIIFIVPACRPPRRWISPSRCTRPPRADRKSLYARDLGDAVALAGLRDLIGAACRTVPDGAPGYHVFKYFLISARRASRKSGRAIA